MKLTSIARMLTVLAVLGLLMPMAFAGKGGKGGGNGNGGGDGAGSALPAVEVVFLARTQGSTCLNCGYDIYVATANQSSMRRVTPDLNLGRRFAMDASGQFVFTDGWGTPRITDLDSDETIVGPIGTNEMPRLTHFRDAGGIAPLVAQSLFGDIEVDTGVINVANGQTVTTRDIVIRPLAGGTDVVLSSNTHDWDPDTGIFVNRQSQAIAWLGDQPGHPGVAWALYEQWTRTFQYEASTNSWTSLSDVRELRVKTFDVSNWSTTGPVETADAAMGSSIPSSDWDYNDSPPTRIAPNGRWVTVTRSGQAYVVPIDYSSGIPAFREPVAADLVPVSVPAGFEPHVEIAAVNEDATLVALHLLREETHRAKYYGRITRVVRRLFVARRDGTDLTQIDVGTDGVEFEYARGSDNFVGVGFRPAAP